MDHLYKKLRFLIENGGEETISTNYIKNTLFHIE